MCLLFAELQEVFLAKTCEEDSEKEGLDRHVPGLSGLLLWVYEQRHYTASIL